MNVSLPVRSISVFLLAIAVTMSVSCGEPYSLKPVEFYHGATPNFRPGPEGGVELVDIKEGVDFSKYKMIILDPPNFRFSSTAEYNAIPRNVLNDLRKEYLRIFGEALRDAYPLVNKPRPDALRLRVLITGIVSSVPGPSTNDGHQEYFSAGGASMKAELLDSLTNDRIAAVMDTKTGDKRSTVQSTDEWVHTREAFAFWAGRLRKFMDNAHGRR